MVTQHFVPKSTQLCVFECYLWHANFTSIKIMMKCKKKTVLCLFLYIYVYMSLYIWIMVKIIYLSYNFNLKQYNLFFSRYYQNFYQYRSPCIYISLSLVAKSSPTLATSWMVACQAPLSMVFSGQEYWSGLPFPFPIYTYTYSKYMGFPDSSDGKESASNIGDLSSITGSGRSPGASHGNPLQYSCLENSMDRGPRQATVYGITKRQT